MKTVCLIVLDGWGIAQPGPGNAITLAQPRHIGTLWQDNPHTVLDASGSAVGLPSGTMGNSEVGHLHLGAGRLIKQDLARISDAIKSSSFFSNKALCHALAHKTVHLLGLVSDGGVHSHLDHLLALIALCHKLKVMQVYVHAITDGRDAPPQSAMQFLRKVENALEKCNKNWAIATILGRYYAMDRDQHWNRTQKAYEALVDGKGKNAAGIDDAIAQAYTRKETDEFILPTVIDPAGRIKNNDAVVFFNLRTDRARQLTQALVHKKFKGFKRTPRKTFFVCLVEYDPALKVQIAFPHEPVRDTLGEILAKHKLRQLRLAETEKWAHVTYFFNGLTDKAFPGEKRTLVSSAKVATFDQKPEMSAYAITKKAIAALASKKYSFVLINFANPDMVGHTGKIEETIKAIKFVDECVAHIVATAQRCGADVIITADHGNAEQKRYPDGSVCTAHTTNKVPFILVSADSVSVADEPALASARAERYRLRTIKKPALYHVAPTVMQLLGLSRPAVMEPGLLR
jgi:2,3-bisphosphoglycerate-independent phosphoglycerate mutase